MVPDQDLRPGTLGGVTQPDRLAHRIGQRLFDQRRHARGDAVQAVVDVKRIGGGHDHPVRALCGEERRQRLVARHTGGLCDFRRGRRRIDNGREASRVARLNELDMGATDQAGAGDGDVELGHGGS